MTRGKIEADPELQSFIRARILTQRFPQVTAAVAAHFPPTAASECPQSTAGGTVTASIRDDLNRRQPPTISLSRMRAALGSRFLPLSA
jgi:hypothetical protein